MKYIYLEFNFRINVLFLLAILLVSYKFASSEMNSVKNINLFVQKHQT